MAMGSLENKFKVRKHINVTGCVIYNRLIYEPQANKVLTLATRKAS